MPKASRVMSAGSGPPRLPVSSASIAGSPVIVARDTAPTVDPIWTARMGANGQYVVLAGLVATAVGCEIVVADPLAAASPAVGLLLGG